MTEVQKTLRSSLILALKEMSQTDDQYREILAVLEKDQNVFSTEFAQLEALMKTEMNELSDFLKQGQSELESGFATLRTHLVRQFKELTEYQKEIWREFVLTSQKDWMQLENGLESLDQRLMKDQQTWNQHLRNAEELHSRSLINLDEMLSKTSFQQKVILKQNETIAALSASISRLNKEQEKMKDTIQNLTAAQTSAHELAIAQQELSNLAARFEALVRG